MATVCAYAIHACISLSDDQLLLNPFFIFHTQFPGNYPNTTIHQTTSTHPIYWTYIKSNRVHDKWQELAYSILDKYYPVECEEEAVEDEVDALAATATSISSTHSSSSASSNTNTAIMRSHSSKVGEDSNAIFSTDQSESPQKAAYDRAMIEVIDAKLMEQSHARHVKDIAGGFRDLLRKSKSVPLFSSQESMKKFKLEYQQDQKETAEGRGGQYSDKKKLASQFSTLSQDDVIVAIRRWKDKAEVLGVKRLSKYAPVSLNSISRNSSRLHDTSAHKVVSRNKMLRPISNERGGAYNSRLGLARNDAVLKLPVDYSTTSEASFDAMSSRGTGDDTASKVISASGAPLTPMQKYFTSCKENGVLPVSAVLDSEHADELHLDSLLLNPKDLNAISDFLISNDTIINLDISNNAIGPKGGPIVANMFKLRPCPFKVIDLSQNNFGDDAMEMIGASIIRLKGLKDLNVQENNMGDKGAEQLADVISQAEHLENVNLSMNRISEATGPSLGNALRAKTSRAQLLSLNLAWNRLGDLGCKEVCLG